MDDHGYEERLDDRVSPFGLTESKDMTAGCFARED